MAEIVKTEYKNHIVKFWLYDDATFRDNRPTIRNIWVASTRVEDNETQRGAAVADAMQLLARHGIDIQNIDFVGFEDADKLKGLP